MPEKLKLGSLFDGIGGWCLSATRAGAEPVWTSEIDPFCIEISKKHFPSVAQLGDVTKINGGEIQPVDIICAGSPCQNFSQAGNKKGLCGNESGLFTEFIRIVRQMRMSTCGLYPKMCVWENVCGAKSRNSGMDFLAIIKMFTQTDIPVPRLRKWADAGVVRSGLCDVGWRVFNAEHFGLPQSRKRIFLVADFRKRNRCAEKILFECKSNSWDFKAGKKGKTLPKSIEKRNDVAGGFEIESPSDCDCVPISCRMRCGKAGGGKGALLGFDKVFTLSTRNDQIVFQEMDGRYIVRKLMPVEMERLQGIPENWTMIDSKLCNNTSRCRAIGNGMAQPVSDWIFKRIVNFINLEEKI